MNAVLKRQREPSESTPMPTNENDNLPTQVAELRSDVRHLQADVTDIKADIRNARGEIQSVRSEIKGEIQGVRGEIQGVRGEIRETNQQVNTLVKAVASAKVWAMGLYVGLAGGLLYILAHAFKWI